MSEDMDYRIRTKTITGRAPTVHKTSSGRIIGQLDMLPGFRVHALYFRGEDGLDTLERVRIGDDKETSDPMSMPLGKVDVPASRLNELIEFLQSLR